MTLEDRDSHHLLHAPQSIGEPRHASRTCPNVVQMSPDQSRGFPNPHDVHLRRSEEHLDEITTLAEIHGGFVGLSGVVDHLNRQCRRVTVPGRLVAGGFTWNDADRMSSRWWPQGITTSADAFDTADFHGRRLLITSWYSKTVEGANHGARLSVIDIDDLTYRHVLVVVPELSSGRVVMRPLNVHAGGLVWCGPYIHVAGTTRGIFTCRVDDIIEVEPSEESFGYRFVLPVSFCYDSVAGDDAHRMRYSFLSLDRSSDPPELVAGEYGMSKDTDVTKRLVRYPLDPETFRLRSGDDGVSRPVWLDEGGVGHMQGAAIVDGTYYVTTSRGRWRLGNLHVGAPGHFRRIPRALPVGPEDITYWPSQRAFWSVSEYPGHRYVFSVDKSALDRT